MDEELVSMGFVLCKASSIPDIGVGIALNDFFVKLVTWFNNDLVYFNRLVDLTICMKSTGDHPKAVHIGH